MNQGFEKTRNTKTIIMVYCAVEVFLSRNNKSNFAGFLSKQIKYAEEKSMSAEDFFLLYIENMKKFSVIVNEIIISSKKIAEEDESRFVLSLCRESQEMISFNKTNEIISNNLFWSECRNPELLNLAKNFI